MGLKEEVDEMRKYAKVLLKVPLSIKNSHKRDWSSCIQ